MGATQEGGRAFRCAVMVRQIAGERATTNRSRKVSRRKETIPLMPANKSA
jgi:hypothetical protein